MTLLQNSKPFHSAGSEFETLILGCSKMFQRVKMMSYLKENKHFDC